MNLEIISIFHHPLKKLLYLGKPKNLSLPPIIFVQEKKIKDEIMDGDSKIFVSTDFITLY